MIVGWIADYPPYQGGAEIAARRFVRMRPSGIHICQSEPSAVPREVDVYVIHNCTQYDTSLIPIISRKPVVKYIHDVWPSGDSELRRWLISHADLIYSSPLQKRHLMHAPPESQRPGVFIPPPIDYGALSLMGSAAEERKGTVWLSRFSMEKGYQNVAHWGAEHNEVVDAYGIRMGVLYPSKWIRLNRPVSEYEVPKLLSQYKRLIHLPLEIEPFGLSVAEGWAAGCDLVLNDNVGAKWWIENKPEELKDSALRFWKYVRSLVPNSSPLPPRPISLA
jgi:hypothetical protein